MVKTSSHMIQHYYTSMTISFSRCEETRRQYKEKSSEKWKIDHLQKELGLLIRWKMKQKDFLKENTIMACILTRPQYPKKA